MTAPVQPILDSMHRYLMRKGFPYHSVSVTYGPSNLGFHCHFSKTVEGRIDQEVLDVMADESSVWHTGAKFTHHINKNG